MSDWWADPALDALSHARSVRLERVGTPGGRDLELEVVMMAATSEHAHPPEVDGTHSLEVQAILTGAQPLLVLPDSPAWTFVFEWPVLWRVIDESFVNERPLGAAVGPERGWLLERSGTPFLEMVRAVTFAHRVYGDRALRHFVVQSLDAIVDIACWGPPSVRLGRAGDAADSAARAPRMR